MEQQVREYLQDNGFEEYTVKQALIKMGLLPNQVQSLPLSSQDIISIKQAYITSGKPGNNNILIENILQEPFFVNVVGDSNRGEFAIAVNMNTSSTLSPECILCLEYSFIPHATHLENLSSILDCQYLVTQYKVSEDYKRTDQYPGVYCTLESDNTHFANFGLEIIFILSLSLLKKKAWHINIFEDYGIISKNTYCYKTLPNFIMYQQAPRNWGELVFHDKVPLDYVECIIVDDDKFVEATNIVQNRYIVYTKTQFSQLNKRKYIKNLYSPGSYTDKEPNFCYHNINEYETKFHTAESIICTLINTGYTRNNAEAFVKHTKMSEVLKFMFNLWKQVIDNNLWPTPTIYPPY